MPRPKQVAHKAGGGTVAHKAGGGTGYTQPIEDAQEQAARLAAKAAALRKQLGELPKDPQESHEEESDLSLESDEESDDEEAQVVTSRPNAKRKTKSHAPPIHYSAHRS